MKDFDVKFWQEIDIHAQIVSGGLPLQYELMSLSPVSI